MSTSNAVQDLLGRVTSEKTVRLVSRGRRSGEPRQVTIWFAVVDGVIGLGTLNEDRNWVKNARHAGEVELVFAAGSLRGRFADVTDPQLHQQIRTAMARKYLPARIASWFGIGQRATFSVGALETLVR
jgi:hypothetical protein